MSGPQTPTRGKTLRILVVDDSAMMRTIVKRTVEVSDLPVGEVLEAATGAEALAVLGREQVDVILTDLNMPGMSGIELLKTLAADPARQALVRVVISTDGSDARRAETLALGVSHYVNKPMRPEALRDVIAAVANAR